MTRWLNRFGVLLVAGLLAAHAGDAGQTGSEPVKLDPKPILDRVLANTPHKDIQLKGRLFPSRRDDPTPFVLLVKVDDGGTRTLLQAGNSEWLIVQPADGPARYYRKDNGELTGPDRIGSILDSHFSMYDLAAPYLRWDKAEYIEADRIKGRDCHVIEVQSETEPYRRVRLWIDRQMDGLLRAEAYDPDGHLVKRFWVSSFRKIGDAWVPRGMDIAWRPPGQSLPSEERSRLEVDDGTYDAGLDPALFDEHRFVAATSSRETELKTELVTYKHGDVELEGYLAYDTALAKAKGKRPGVLVVHEWKGLGAHAKQSAEELARLGYVAFAVDMYGKGVRPKDNNEAAAEAGKYKGNRGLMRARILAGLDQLKQYGFVDSTRIAAIGYCFGGTTVLELARSGADVKGVVSFHGGLDSPNPDDGKNIKARVLVLHGADDPFVPAADIAAFEKEMRDSGVNWQMVSYPDAVHSFTNREAGTDNSKGAAYNERAARQSWEAMKAFFGEIFR